MYVCDQVSNMTPGFDGDGCLDELCALVLPYVMQFKLDQDFIQMDVRILILK